MGEKARSAPAQRKKTTRNIEKNEWMMEKDSRQRRRPRFAANAPTSKASW